MTRGNIQAELDRDPFIPLRFHLASGKTFDVRYPNVAFGMDRAVVLLNRLNPGTSAIGGYDVVSLRNIEKVEQLHNGRRIRRRKGTS